MLPQEQAPTLMEQYDITKDPNYVLSRLYPTSMITTASLYAYYRTPSMNAPVPPWTLLFAVPNDLYMSVIILLKPGRQNPRADFILYDCCIAWLGIKVSVLIRYNQIDACHLLRLVYFYIPQLYVRNISLDRRDVFRSMKHYAMQFGWGLLNTDTSVDYAGPPGW